MKNDRRIFLKYAGLAGLGVAGSKISMAFSFPFEWSSIFANSDMESEELSKKKLSIIGLYGNWASSLTDKNPEDSQNIVLYNQWARNHEDVMAKSLFSAGTTWPGFFFAEDRIALDILCAREDVDSTRIGCGGLSGNTQI